MVIEVSNGLNLKEYYPIEFAAFKKIMDKFGFEEIKIRGVKERVFDFKLNEIIIRVYSSIEGDSARGCGEDAIRVCCIDPRTNTGLIRNKRVHRIWTWEKNLLDRLLKTFEDIKAGLIHLAPSCPKCSHIMILRTAKSGAFKGKDFWGCSNYPRCKSIVNV